MEFSYEQKKKFAEMERILKSYNDCLSKGVDVPAPHYTDEEMAELGRYQALMIEQELKGN